MSTLDPSVAVPGTTGDPYLDQDDEIATMSMDAGDSAADETDPPGVDGSTRTPIRIKDPLDPEALRYLYLFESTGGLDPAAGSDYVSYDWRFEPALVPGYFKEPGVAGPGYDFGSSGNVHGGPLQNPEASSVSTDLYRQTFPARWMVDGLSITAGSASGVDILDGDKTTVGTTGCVRNELTFSQGGGGFIASIDGPVRAIRSFVGANSGTYTQRDQVYYRGRVDTSTFLRVHPGVDGTTTAMDYSEAARGMIYRNSLNPTGVTIDGQPDTPVAGQLSWEQVSGAQGSATLISRGKTDISSLTQTSFYLDQENPAGSSMLCSGDEHAFGASGPMLTGTGPHNTDPIRDEPLKHLTVTRYTYIDPPGATMDRAVLRSQQVDSPLVLSTGTGVDPTGPLSDPDPEPPGIPGRANWVGLKVTAKPKRARIDVGVRKTLKVKVRNIGDLPARHLKVCPVRKKRLVRTSRCRKLRKLKPGRAAILRFRVRPRRAARGRKFKLRFRAKARQSKARSARVKLRVRRR